MIFIPATPRSELRNKFEREIKKSGFKIRVVEKAGRSLRDKLQKSDPFKNKQCRDNENCLVCRSGGKGMCRNENITYEIKCNECDHLYIGESARNGYTRGLEHARDLQKKDKNSVLYRHVQLAHQNNTETTNFTMNITGTYRDALTRQLNEAQSIETTPLLINNKSEFGHHSVPRCGILLSSQQQQQRAEGSGFPPSTNQ